MASDDKKLKYDPKWDALNLTDLGKYAATRVHYSFRYANSNVSGGIRLPADHECKLPYVSGVTYHSKDTQMPCDYVTFLTISTFNKFIEYSIANGENQQLVEEFDNVSVTSQSAEHNCDDLMGIATRLAQILLPTNEGYVSVTPTTPAAFPLLIDQELKIQDCRLSRMDMNHGGKNAINVGMFAMNRQTTAVILGAPTESPTIRAALSLYYKGIDLSIPSKLIVEYLEWLEKIKHHNMSSAKNRDKEKTFISKMVEHIKTKVSNVSNEVITELKNMNDGVIDFSPALSSRDILKGMFTGAGVGAWKHELAETLASQISNFSNRQVTATLDDTAFEQLINILENML